MKHYKLLKDLPTFKAGDEFELTKQGHLVFVRGAQEAEEGQILVAYASSTLEKFPNILTDWFEEIEESKNKRWRAKENGGHYFVDEATLSKKLKELSTSATIWYLTERLKETSEKARKWDEYTAKLSNNLPNKNLSAEQRSEAARKAVQARWAKKQAK